MGWEREKDGGMRSLFDLGLPAMRKTEGGQWMDWEVG